MSNKTENTWQEISEDDALGPGDQLQMRFKTTSNVYIQAIQLFYIEKRLAKRPEFDLLTTEHRNGQLILTIKIQRPAEPEQQEPELQQAGIITAGVIVAIVVGIITPIVWYLSLTGLYKKAKPVAIGGAIAAGGLGIAAAVLGLLSIFKKR